MRKNAKRVISVILVFVILALQVNAGVLAFDNSAERSSELLTPILGSGCIVDYTNKFIYGLATEISSLESYVNVPPGYQLNFVPTHNGFGTGTLANVVAEDIIIESYTIIIFGDVNGDGNIDGTDAALAVDHENFKIIWDPIIDAVYIKAADINGDGNTDSLDAGIAIDVENYIASINQTGGLPYTSRITFDSADGTPISDLFGDKGDAVIIPAEPIRIGYTFVGWQPALPTEFTVGFLAVTAQWTVKQCTITFDSFGGTKVADATQDYGTHALEPLAPTKIGYSFGGWYSDVDLITPVSWPYTLGAANVTFYAKWIVNNYNITFDANGGIGGWGPTSMAYATTLTAPTVTREGYTFGSWTPSVPQTVPAEDAVYMAQWTVNEYKISFDSAGGTAVADIAQDYGAAVTAPNAPTRTGYTFIGWEPFVPQSMPAENVECVAQWAINQYSVSFNSNGGTDVVSITQNYNTQLLVPPMSTKTGHTISGWYSDVDLITPVSWPYTLGAANVTFYAKWTVNNYNITFAANGGTGGIGPTSMAYGTALTAPTVTRVGYTFSSWSPSVPGTVPAKNAVYTAQWSINAYKISFDSVGGTTVADITQDYGTAVTEPGSPTKIGYTFDGWVPSVPQAMPAGDVECVAQWIVNQYSVSFNSNGGTAVVGITQNYNTQVSTPLAPTKTGYTFDGWYSDLDLITPVSWPYTLGATNVILYAKWTVNNYNMTFDANGGTGGWGPTSMAYGTALTAPTVTRVGYTFSSWSPSVPGTVPAKNAVYTAQWSINAYKISFDSAGGTAVSDIVQDYATVVTAPNDPIKTGYTFTGWEPSAPQAMPAENVECVAQWTINQYTVSFASNGGTAVSDITQNYNMQVAEPTAPTQKGHTFGGWYSDAGLTTAVSWPYTLGAANATFYAKWTINNYNVTFATNGGIGGWGPTSMVYGSTLTAPTVTREGYNFSSWSPSVPGTVPEKDAVYTAQWSINAYKISFDSVGGTTVADITQDYGTSVIAPNAPTKTGYTFVGWVPSVPQAMPAENTKCVAQWTISQYTVSFDSNGGTAVTKITQNYNTQVSAPTAPTKTGHTFDGWCADATLITTVFWPYTLGAANVTLYAKWTVNNYNITFAANDGTGGIGPTSMAYGTALTAPTVTRVGHTFSSWSPSVPGTVPAKNAVYTAQWSINEYKISFDSVGGTTVADITQDYGTTVTAPDDPTKTGYTFAGWQPAVPVTMPAEGLTCVASWHINYYPITFDANGGIGGQIPSVAYGVEPTPPGVTKLGYAFDGWLPAITTVSGATTYTAQWVPYTDYDTDDLVVFGSYPQTKVTDPVLISALNASTLNADNTVDFEGAKYKREYFTEYIAIEGGMTQDPSSSYQDDNGYFIDTVYWFKYEPIQWRVLSNTDGELLVIADKILNSKQYSDQPSTDVTWETCSSRIWLNSEFLNTAFDSNLQAKITTSLLDNPDNPDYETHGGNTTYDKLFLLSYAEVAEPQYGFNSDFEYSDVRREAIGTDFAECTGLYVIDFGITQGRGIWWLRSPGEYERKASFVESGGNGTYYGNSASYTSIGIRPALKINVNE